MKRKHFLRHGRHEFQLSYCKTRQSGPVDHNRIKIYAIICEKMIDGDLWGIRGYISLREGFCDEGVTIFTFPPTDILSFANLIYSRGPFSLEKCDYSKPRIVRLSSKYCPIKADSNYCRDGKSSTVYFRRRRDKNGKTDFVKRD